MSSLESESPSQPDPQENKWPTGDYDPRSYLHTPPLLSGDKRKVGAGAEGEAGSPTLGANMLSPLRLKEP